MLYVYYPTPTWSINNKWSGLQLCNPKGIHHCSWRSLISSPVGQSLQITAASVAHLGASSVARGRPMAALCSGSDRKRWFKSARTDNTNRLFVMSKNHHCWPTERVWFISFRLAHVRKLTFSVAFTSSACSKRLRETRYPADSSD